MIERAFLDAVRADLARPGALSPPAALIGIAEPAQAEELPALVLSIEGARRFGSGVGERTSVVTGALRWTSEIDLANPVLPAEPAFRLLSQSRLTLALPHGGLVRADGTAGPASPPDIEVRVGGQLRTLAAANPGAGEFTADLGSGVLVFGAALPETGIVRVTYFVGQWERRSMRSEAVLLMEVMSGDPDQVRALSDSATGAIETATQRIAGLASISVLELGSIKVVPAPAVASRRRTLRFQFHYELEVNRPDPSGGVIREIPVNALLA